MKILKNIGFVVLFVCIFLCYSPFSYAKSEQNTIKSNVQISDLQIQKKINILKILEKENLINNNIKKLNEKQKEDILCLSLNMYHENRGSTIDDRLASTYVVYNRQQKKQNASLCDIIFEKWQFCWTNNATIPVPKELKIWYEIQNTAYKIYFNPKFKKYAKEFRLTHYVATYMLPMKRKPKWIDKRYFDISIGKHSYLSLNKEDINYKNEIKKSIIKGIELLKR